MNKVPVVLTAFSYEFEERVIIVIDTLDKILQKRPQDYIRVSGQKKGEGCFMEHQVQLQSLKDFFIVQSPKNREEAF